MTREEGKAVLSSLIEVATIALDAINYHEMMMKEHDCNDCGYVCCKYRPRPGERTRINCPLWKRREP